MSAATTLRDALKTQWGLGGLLSKVSTGSGETLMDQVVKFYDRLQVKGNESPKAVIVQKINAEENENNIQHPNFNEIIDIYEIAIRYRVVDVNADNYSTYINLIEQMGTEVTRILKTIYNPSSTTSIYFRTNKNWTIDDIDVGNQRDLRRTLRFSLTSITSDDPEVYSGFGGVLVFDTSDSQGDSKPVVNYTFVSVKNIDTDEGFSQIPTLTKDKSKGVGVPLLMRGQFSGTFSALMYAQKTNIIGNTVEKLQNIYKLQNSSPVIGQTAEVVLLRSSVNTESNVSTLTRKSFMRINRIKENTPDEDLISYTIIGTLSRPTIFTESV